MSLVGLHHVLNGWGPYMQNNKHSRIESKKDKNVFVHPSTLACYSIFIKWFNNIQSIIKGHSTFSMTFPHLKLVSTISMIIKLMFSIFLNLLKHHGWGRITLTGWSWPFFLSPKLGPGHPLTHRTHPDKAEEGPGCPFSVLRTGSENLACPVVTGRGGGGGGVTDWVIANRQIEIWPGPTPNLLRKIWVFFFLLLFLFLVPSKKMEWDYSPWRPCEIRLAYMHPMPVLSGRTFPVHCSHWHSWITPFGTIHIWGNVCIVYSGTLGI